MKISYLGSIFPKIGTCSSKTFIYFSKVFSPNDREEIMLEEKTIQKLKITVELTKQGHEPASVRIDRSAWLQNDDRHLKKGSYFCKAIICLAPDFCRWTCRRAGGAVAACYFEASDFASSEKLTFFFFWKNYKIKKDITAVQRFLEGKVQNDWKSRILLLKSFDFSILKLWR